ncbi:MAG: nucleotide exchange factor GrpE [bacterium]|nr:nucleotide exchange factor GrpE [bacterium]
MDNQKPQVNIEDLVKELEQCKKEKEEYLNGWKRAKADFINYQKDETKRIDEVMKFSNEMLIRELLPVLDSFQLSLSVMASPAREDAGARRGVEIIQSQFEDILKKHGLEPIKALGSKFDPSLHEAVEEAESDKESGTVIEELTRGWKLHGRVIRPARVKIAK